MTMDSAHKREIVSAYLAGAKVRDIVDSLGVSKANIGSVISAWEEHGDSIFGDAAEETPPEPSEAEKAWAAKVDKILIMQTGFKTPSEIAEAVGMTPQEVEDFLISRGHKPITAEQRTPEPNSLVREAFYKDKEEETVNPISEDVRKAAEEMLAGGEKIKDSIGLTKKREPASAATDTGSEKDTLDEVSEEIIAPAAEKVKCPNAVAVAIWERIGTLCCLANEEGGSDDKTEFKKLVSEISELYIYTKGE